MKNAPSLTFTPTLTPILSWYTAKAHPGGVAVLQKFNNRDATKAFHAARHSAAAVEMLKGFAIRPENESVTNADDTVVVAKHSSQSMAIPPPESSSSSLVTKVPRWRAKLFTKEDPIGVHKYLGVFVLMHFAFRFFQMFFTDPSAGFGTRMGKRPSWIPVTCLIPHALLSLSSLMFHTVPKDRVVGKPMIWQEYRVHNIGFALRSVIATALCAIAVHGGNTPGLRRLAVWGSSFACILAMVAADLATKYLRSNQLESTTATMPYWEGCSVTTQKRFKSFYAYCQFMATLTCLAVTNPALPLAILLPIQLASLLMTLVRKGLLTARGLHLAYTASLVAPYFIALRSTIHMQSPEFLVMFAVGAVLFQLRRRGVNKYALWIPVIAARIAVGDKWLSYDVW